jgi:hypothetical protein
MRLVKYLLLLAVLLPSVAFGASSYTYSYQGAAGYGPFVMEIDIVADSGDGSVDNITLGSSSVALSDIEQLRQKGYFLYALVTDPGTTAPTDNYDITLNSVTPAGTAIDMLGGNGANRDEANTEYASMQVAYPVTNTTMTLTVSNNSVNSAQIKVLLFFAR